MSIRENHTDYLKEDFGNKLPEDNSTCPICGGEGMVTVMEYVYPGEPHMAPVGSSKCECQVVEDDQYPFSDAL